MRRPATEHAENYKPGSEVEASGLYRVNHDPEHAGVQEVICIRGRIFPPCRGCDNPRFVLVRAGCRVEDYERFAPWIS